MYIRMCTYICLYSYADNVDCYLSVCDHCQHEDWTVDRFHHEPVDHRAPHSLVSPIHTYIDVLLFAVQYANKVKVDFCTW